MPNSARIAILAAALIALAACAPSNDKFVPMAQLASQYVTLDTLGYNDAADTLTTDCGDNASNGLISPTSGVFVGKPFVMPMNDTVRVLVIYSVLGIAHAEDGNLVGPQFWRFNAAPRHDTVVLRMAPDSAGRLWIACGPFHADHTSITQMGEALARMDSASLVELELAKQGKRAAPPESK